MMKINETYGVTEIGTNWRIDWYLEMFYLPGLSTFWLFVS